MSARPTHCPYCQTRLQRIRLLTPPTPDVFRNGTPYADGTGVTVEIPSGLSPGRPAGLGEVRGLICRKCWRLL